MKTLIALFGSSETPITPRAGPVGALIALVAGAMAFLAVAALEAGLGADRIAGRWSGELSDAATVRVLAPDADREGVVAAALAALEITPGVAAARRLSEAENRALLAPWLGGDADVAALPLPVLIDVSIEGGGPDVAEIRSRLALAAPGAFYDDHGEWRAPLVRAASGLRYVAAFGAALAIGALAAMVTVATAATLWSGTGVVHTLRLIGAEDRFIVQTFERSFALRAGLGALAGALIARLLAAQMPKIEGVEVLAGGASASTWAAWLLLLIAPLVAALTALGATRAAAFIVLRRG